MVKGSTIATGEGNYPQLIIEDYDGDKRWIAVKNFDGTWTMYFGKGKLAFEYIKFNEKKVEDLEVVQKLIECTDEVINLYKYD